MSPEATEAGLAQGWKTVMLDIVAIEIGEKLLQPLIHNLMVGPPVVKLSKKNRSTLTSLISQRWKNVCGQVPFDGFSVPLVQLTGPVVR
jgi:hypothetical protein